MGKNPTCGHCGKLLSAHYREFHREELIIYCFTDTNGDIFTDYPNDNVILDRIEEKLPEIRDQIITEWKQENGHT